MDYQLSVAVDLPVAAALDATRAALASQGFGILTEIDMAATLKAKLGVEIPPQFILGACNPPFAHAALQAEPSIGLLLPCNVVVRQGAGAGSIVEAIDPMSMVTITGNERLRPVAQEVAARLRAGLDALGT